MKKTETEHIRAVNNVQPTGDALPALVQQIKENSLSIILSYLENLFGSCDDLFFDLSSRAANNNEQNLYFESMRELRVKKNGVIAKFRQQIEQHFVDCVQPGKNQLSSAERSTSAEEEGLSLVQHDEIEQNVAINGMTGKARNNNQDALYQLTTRLDYLVPGNTITQDNNPIDPQQLCQSFASACELLEINIKAKIILYKQFDRLAISRLANLYSNANDLLVNAGIIPNITRTVKHSTSAAGSGSTSSAENDTGAARNTDPMETHRADEQAAIDFVELTNLLANMRNLGISHTQNYQTYSNNPGPTMSSQEFLTTLSLLQQQIPAASNTQAPPDNSIRQLVDIILSKANPEAPQAVKQPDDDVINLVAMFFDFVLDDRNLPIPMQAIISRLQIPILKIALRDQSFFSNSRHPARKLVNSLAAASIGWDDSSDPLKDKTYHKIASIVQDIIEHDGEDDMIFEGKLAELKEFMSRTMHRSSLIEKRTGQAAQGQARTNEAKTAAQQVLFEQLNSAHLPAAFSQFLVEQWQQMLIITHLKHGEDSPDWLDAVQLIQDLIWACQPKPDEKSKQRLSNMKDDLMRRVMQGLSTVSNTEEESAGISEGLKSALDAIQQNQLGKDQLRPLSVQQAQALGHTPGGGSKTWNEMSALERQQSRHKKLTYEFIKKAEALPLASWISYEDNKDGRVLRCKLSAKIEVSDSFIFVNRFGFKVLEKSRKDFAYDMQQNRVKVLASGPLFDRAMSRILGNLRQSSDSSSDTPPGS